MTAAEETLKQARAILAAHAAPTGPSKADTISALVALLSIELPMEFSDAFAEDRLNSERYRLLRDVPDHLLGVAGHPCIAVPINATTGFYSNGADADREVDAAIVRAFNAQVSPADVLTVTVTR